MCTTYSPSLSATTTLLFMRQARKLERMKGSIIISSPLSPFILSPVCTSASVCMSALMAAAVARTHTHVGHTHCAIRIRFFPRAADIMYRVTQRLGPMALSLSLKDHSR